jgi:hypothetical protein
MRSPALGVGLHLAPGRFPRAIVRLKRLGQLKKSNDIIGNRTRDLPACSTVPQLTTLTRGPNCYLKHTTIVMQYHYCHMGSAAHWLQNTDRVRGKNTIQRHYFTYCPPRDEKWKKRNGVCGGTEKRWPSTVSLQSKRLENSITFRENLN